MSADLLSSSVEPAPAADFRRTRSLARAAWEAAWPKLAAVGVLLAVWQLLVWSGWRPDTVLPAPQDVLARLGA
ncbi:MAG TPA: ABC transporter permease, partial [Mycobacteriales bacterium]|nr:ABC transporter permease [Mycobacteriales bacterium]